MHLLRLLCVRCVHHHSSPDLQYNSSPNAPIRNSAHRLSGAFKGEHAVDARVQLPSLIHAMTPSAASAASSGNRSVQEPVNTPTIE
jgi:hypothetical protein